MAVHLPLLARLFVASPCTAEWSEMSGDDRARHCGKCKQTVYNLSDMTREAAEALLFEKNGDLCVRYFARRDGTILTQDCSVGVKQARKRKLVAAGAALLASVGAAGGTAVHILRGTEPSEPDAFDDRQVMMGDVAYLPDPVVNLAGTAPAPAPAHEDGEYVMGGVGPAPIVAPPPPPPATEPAKHHER